MKTLLMIWPAIGFIACASVLAGPAEGEQAAPTGKMAALDGRLATVRGEMAKVRERIQEENQEYFKMQQHDAVYTNSPAAAVYQEIKVLERELAEKRKKLDVELQKIPEIRAITKRRKTLYKQLAGLKDRELLIRREMRTEQRKRAGGKPQGKPSL